MSDLKYPELMRLVSFFQMEEGYVLDFSNERLRRFVVKICGIDIYEDRFAFNGGSKAKRLRAYFELESDYNVGCLIDHLCEYRYALMQTGKTDNSQESEKLYNACKAISNRLLSSGKVENLEAINPNADDIDFTRLSELIRECIAKDQPETCLDRLHTFTTRYIREECTKLGIEFDKHQSLHGMYGKYIKFLIEKGLVESVMSIRILKSSISLLEAFNSVRNENSFAHDNPILNYNESILIFNSVSSTLKFLQSLNISGNDNDEPGIIPMDNW